MAQPSTLFRFKIEVSDIERGVYDSLDFRLARHPSESNVYMLTKIIAFILNMQDGLEFSPEGLADPEVAAIRLPGSNNSIQLWIEIGNPSPKKLHKSAKAAKAVKVYTYKDPQVLLKDLATEHIHNSQNIEIFSISSKFLEKFEQYLERDNKWSVIYQDRLLTLNVGNISEQTEITPWSLI